MILVYWVGFYPNNPDSGPLSLVSSPVKLEMVKGTQNSVCKYCWPEPESRHNSEADSRAKALARPCKAVSEGVLGSDQARWLDHYYAAACLATTILLPYLALNIIS